MAAPFGKFCPRLSSRLSPSFQAERCTMPKVSACLCSQQATSPSAEGVRTDPLKPAQPEFVESREDFKWVERLIPRHQIPPIPEHPNYPTPCGWVPPRDPPPDLPYSVRRSRFCHIPVYQRFRKGGSRKQTVIAHIEGDIWALEKELEKFLPAIIGRNPAIQVNEVARKIVVKGLVMEEVKKWLLEKGF
ncbi:39S ribosomal protein L49, mitochondrial-like [Branchiostoma floridae]|uniref:Large ribosomal subunit protein mL49 n=2 Tax=Branchiostoma floridae TaxID=7739 RepID=A0A9J7KQ36_BRAFL|nr:39S ribosomal protein L49, mitochondrial-like [Branchiostoma floridae]